MARKKDKKIDQIERQNERKKDRNNYKKSRDGL